jgi:hypothetical protein
MTPSSLVCQQNTLTERNGTKLSRGRSALEFGVEASVPDALEGSELRCRWFVNACSVAACAFLIETQRLPN